MNKSPQFSIYIAVILLFFMLAACVIQPAPAEMPVTPTEPPEANLSGRWQVNEIYFDQTIKRTFDVDIEHHGGNLTILRDGKEVVTCTVEQDKLTCTNWEAYGFSIIFIDGPNSMHSELPMAESVNRLDFIKSEE